MRSISRFRATAAPPGSRRARALAVVAAMLVGALAAGATLSLTSATSGELGPGRVEPRAGLGASRTTLHLPPLGTIWADTHGGVVGVQLRVDQVHVAEVQDLIATGTAQRRLRADVDSDLRPLTRRLAQRALIFSALAGAVAATLLPRRRWWSPMAGALGGTLTIVVLFGAAWRSFEAEAFEVAPVFEGPLEEAPRIVDTVLEHVEGLDDISDRFAVLSGHIADLYATNLGLEEGRPGNETRILHVSDIHLNPIGLEITRQLAREFDAHAVLDTGDLTSFGQPFEAVIVPLVENVGVPYLFVPGNHDSIVNRVALAAASNVTLVDREVVTVGPVRIIGAADPTFTATNEMSHEEANQVLADASATLRPLVARQRPDILAVHNTRLAKDSLGRVPLVLAGHLHRTTREDQQGTLVLTVGSTGSTGLGELTQTEEPRYEAQILRFRGTALVAVDRLRLQGRRGDFQISREVIDRPPLAPEPLSGRFQ